MRIAHRPPVVIGSEVGPRMVGAALAAVVAGAHAGTSVEDVVAAGLAAARGVAGRSTGDIGLSVTQVGGGEHLRKSALLVVRIRVDGEPGAADGPPRMADGAPRGDAPSSRASLEIARTLVVGFDTLAADAQAADRAVRAMTAAESAARVGSSLEAIRAAAVAVISDAIVRAELRPALIADRSVESLAEGDCLYIEVAISPPTTGRPDARSRPTGYPSMASIQAQPREGSGVVLGDTVRVMPDHAEPIATFPIRLWL